MPSGALAMLAHIYSHQLRMGFGIDGDMDWLVDVFRYVDFFRASSDSFRMKKARLLVERARG